MSSTFRNYVQRPGIETTLGIHESRLGRLERGDIGRWHYVTPIAPAPTPDDLIPNDPIVAFFLSSWGNKILPNGTYAPLRFRVHPATKVEIEGAVTGGAVGTDLFRLPVGFRPAVDERAVFASVDGSQAMTLSVSASTGLVTVLAVIAGSGGTGLVFDFANVGDWFTAKTTGAGGSVTTDYSTYTPGIGFVADGGPVVIGTLGSGAGQAIYLDSNFINLHTPFLDVEVDGGYELRVGTGIGFEFDFPGSGLGFYLNRPGDGSNFLGFDQSGFEVFSAAGGILLESTSPTDPASIANIAIESSGVTSIGWPSPTTLAVGLDLEVTLPGPGGTPGTDVFEVIGDFRDSTDTWEWDGATKTYAKAAPVLPLQDFGGSVSGAMGYDVANAYTLVWDQFSHHTWTYNGATWTDLGVTATNPGLSSPVMVYERANNRILMFGMLSGPFRIGVFFWNGADWTQIVPTTFPPFFASYAIAYDEANSRTVLHRGGETWLFYANDYHHVVPAHDPGTGFGWDAMAWDGNGNQVVLAGQNPFGTFVLWSWDGTDWTQRLPTYTPQPPVPRATPGWMCWDGTNVWMFAGRPSLNQYPSNNDALRDTWTWDGVGAMTFVKTSPLPPGRWNGNQPAMFAYDSARGKTVLYGGSLDATVMLIAGLEGTDAGSPAIVHLREDAVLQYDL